MGRVAFSSLPTTNQALQRTIQDINRTGATSIFEGLNMFNRMATQIEIAQNETICGTLPYFSCTLVFCFLQLATEIQIHGFHSRIHISYNL